ncbi:MAG: LLM class flavin-dependent oxidoreductase [Spongiibacteraceae bacterium]
MKLGSCHLWGDDLEDFCNQIKLAHQLGYDLIGVGDSPAGWHDVYISLAIAAQIAPNTRLMPFVTSPFIRHPLAAANALCSLDELSHGQVQLGLSTGGSNIMAIGHKPASQAKINDYWQAISRLFSGNSAQYENRPVAALQYPRKIPIYYSAFGPKALALAGQKADGVILFSNDNFDLLDEKIAIVRNAAHQAGRNADDIEIIVTSYCSIRPTRRQALDDLKAFIVVNGLALARSPELMAQIPAEHRAAINELLRRYDTSEHVQVGGKNSQLLDELGLTDYLGQFDTIAGTPAYVAKVLSELKQRGVSTFVVNMPGHADREGTMRELANIRNQLA